MSIDADAYVLRRVIRDWSDEQATAVLKSIQRACKPDARLNLLESAIPETAEFDMGKWMDVNMLVTAGGTSARLLNSASFTPRPVSNSNRSSQRLRR